MQYDKTIVRSFSYLAATEIRRDMEYGKLEDDGGGFNEEYVLSSTFLQHYHNLNHHLHCHHYHHWPTPNHHHHHIIIITPPSSPPPSSSPLPHQLSQPWSSPSISSSSIKQQHSCLTAAIPQQPKFTTDRLKNIHYHHCQSGRPSVIFSTNNYDTQVNAYHKEEDNEEDKVPLCVHTTHIWNSLFFLSYVGYLSY